MITFTQLTLRTNLKFVLEEGKKYIKVKKDEVLIVVVEGEKQETTVETKKVFFDKSILYLGDYTMSQTQITLTTSWRVTKELKPQVDMNV